MKMRKIIHTTLAFLLFLGLSLSACDSAGSDEYTFEDWDQDGNEMLDEKEFYRAYAGIDYHNQWDTDQDRAVNQEEWERGVANYWVAYDIGEFGAFSSWDPDVHGNLAEERFRERIFIFYDKDGDGYLNGEEYRNWHSDLSRRN